jgi:hypothetical protein
MRGHGNDVRHISRRAILENWIIRPFKSICRDNVSRKPFLHPVSTKWVIMFWRASAGLAIKTPRRILAAQMRTRGKPDPHSQMASTIIAVSHRLMSNRKTLCDTANDYHSKKYTLKTVVLPFWRFAITTTFTLLRTIFYDL